MSDRELSVQESELLEIKANQFVTSWAAHGTDLTAIAEVRHQRFLILMVDDELHMASGCSIDSSIHFVQEVGKSIEVDFFNRMLFAYKNDQGQILTAKLSEIADLAKDRVIKDSTVIFNNMVTTKSALDDQWEVKISDSPYKRWL